MGILKVAISVVLIGVMECIVEWPDKKEKYCFEIAMSILMAGWIMHSGW